MALTFELSIVEIPLERRWRVETRAGRQHATVTADSLTAALRYGAAAVLLWGEAVQPTRGSVAFDSARTVEMPAVRVKSDKR